MAKLTLMQGLPASGKSTRAAEIHTSANTIRINRDLLRTMLHFDKWTGKNESLTRDAARVLATHFLQAGINVIIDDTNLNPSIVQSWKDLAKEFATKFEYQRMDTPYEECLKRDRSREKHVGDYVITQMALQYGLYPKPEKGVILCDLDGTLADIKHRLHFVKVPEGEKKDWKSFFAGIKDDKIRIDTLDRVLAYEKAGHQIFFVSARPDNYRAETEAWLHEYYGLPWAGLIMRSKNDSRPDTDVKRDMYTKFFAKLPIETVIDDRPVVIRMWQELGVPVIDVGSGVEF